MQRYKFITILILIDNLSTIPMRAGEEYVMPQWLHSIIFLKKRLKTLFFTDRYVCFVCNSCKSFKGTMQQISRLALIDILFLQFLLWFMVSRNGCKWQKLIIFWDASLWTSDSKLMVMLIAKITKMLINKRHRRLQNYLTLQSLPL